MGTNREHSAMSPSPTPRRRGRWTPRLLWAGVGLPRTRPHPGEEGAGKLPGAQERLTERKTRRRRGG